MKIFLGSADRECLPCHDGRMRRGDLTNAEWERLAPLLPPASKRGRRWEDHRAVINAVLYQARTGARWRNLPERFGCWVDIYRCHRRWAADGTWQRLLAALQADQDNVGQVDRGIKSTKSTSRRAPRSVPSLAGSKGSTASDPALARLRAHLAEVVGQTDV
ncbi:transposase [Nonomuraea sp. M3C6]|uniref:Transposase n=1 Tax=Nonomuraea marmarensis TaxID=3351344 RepID=A0ABW7ABN9_9ACTN